MTGFDSQRFRQVCERYGVASSTRSADLHVKAGPDSDVELPHVHVHVHVRAQGSAFHKSNCGQVARNSDRDAPPCPLLWGPAGAACRRRIAARRRFYVYQAVRAWCGVAGLAVARVRKIWRAM